MGILIGNYFLVDLSAWLKLAYVTNFTRNWFMKKCRNKYWSFEKRVFF